ncbi:phosphotransferase RcsD [Cronobacter sakazakii]
MSQPDAMIPNKFSLMPGSITRFFLLLIVVLLVTMGVMVQSAVNAWLKDKSYQIVDISHALHKRVDTYRYATWQIYDNIGASAAGQNGEGLQETRLRQDVYYLEKPHRKTEALIFGSHDSSTLDMTQRISSYLDTLWGAEGAPWSMYYLNGQDNSMILVSTLPLKDLSAGFKENSINAIADSRRAEMLQQANALDERESFSPLRKLAWQNGYYFTLRTTFNQPGHLATVVAFDVPINDLIPPGMPLESFRLEPDSSQNALTGQNKDDPDSVTINFNSNRIEISSALTSTQLRIIWEVPFGSLLMETLQNILLPLLLNIGLLALALFGYTTFRHQPSRPVEAVTNSANNAELQMLRALNEEILSVLPLGLLVHDQESSRTIMSNKIADHLLPHLNLQNITSMADQHQGIIQATVNNELYEIRLFRSQVVPRTQIFIIRDQDREILVNKKLKQAQRLYEKNQQGRSAFMQNIGAALKEPTQQLAHQAALIEAPESQVLAEQAERIARLVDEIQLVNQLEADFWRPTPTDFTIQELIDEVVPEVLPVIKRKGLQLLINNQLAANEERHGDREALRKVLLMLLHYSVTTTQIGKITLEIMAEEGARERLLFRVLDTGEGISNSEIDNLHFPFLNDTSNDQFGKANGLTFYLCNQLARRLGGHLNIKARKELGTRYSLHVTMPVEPLETEESDERLLDDVIAMIDITSNEVRNVVVRQLEQWGASCITPDERLSSQEYDIFLTDNPSNLTANGLLLSDDEAGVRRIGPGQLRVNFNISHAMQEAVLQLIEEQLAQEDIPESPMGGDENAQLHASGYYALFVDTVPDDVQRLYTESSAGDFAALAQTAHRLKGVFAMLNLVPGKQLCETLEHLIREKDATAIEIYISDIDVYVKSLL